MKSKINAPKAYAWKIRGGICRWAEPNPRSMTTKPSPEAVIIPVRIVYEGDWRKLTQKKK